MKQLILYNTRTRNKDIFTPISPKRVGLYVCGPTVYGDPHLGHARVAIVFDTLVRYFIHLGYKVRYVRNVTDVGHLTDNADEEDKIIKKAHLENLEPMEVVHYYLNRYHKAIEALNVLPPNIEPHASGHIIEQIQTIQKIIANGYAYEKKGSVYFDVTRYNQKYCYGILSKRKIENMIKTTRKLSKQEEKNQTMDFALWKKASPQHIMSWASPWGSGFPGWHIECTTMSKKYLGEIFDIHGGGMDLIFPHHECEIAQSIALSGYESVKYWIHNNMVTVNGQKMGKSLGNFITLEELFIGNNHILTQAYDAMTIRFFLLQAHYRSTIDFSDKSLQSSKKGLTKLLEAYNFIKYLEAKTEHSTVDIKQLELNSFNAINNDLNTPIVISYLFEASRLIYSAFIGQIKLTIENINQLKSFFQLFLFNLLGVKEDLKNSQINYSDFKKVVELLLNIRLLAKQNKDWNTSDKIRNELTSIGFEVNDTKCGFEWKFKGKQQI